jgi:hypothetical protein
MYLDYYIEASVSNCMTKVPTGLLKHADLQKVMKSTKEPVSSWINMSIV